MHRHEPIDAQRVARHLTQRIAPAATSVVVPLEVEVWEPVAASGVPGQAEPVPVAEGLAAQYEPFEVGTTWGPPWGTTWFRLTGEVPPEDRNGDLEVVVELGWSDGSPGFQCEGTVYRPDGSIIKGIHPRNTWIPVELDEAGRFQVYLEAASNPIISSWATTERGDVLTSDAKRQYELSRADIVRVHREVRELVADVITLEGLVRDLPADSHRRAEVRVALDRAMDALDIQDVPATAAAARERLAGVMSRPAEGSAHHAIAVGHAHIDSAWLWPVRETRRKVARTIANVLRLADDGQPIVFAFPAAQHSAWLQQDHPDLFARLQAAVAAGVVVPVGGMWVESDANLPGGEAMVRQLVEGAVFFEEAYGYRCQEVWLPDSFGYSGALPQLARLAGARWFLTQKISWNQVDDFPHHSFHWEGIDGTRIFTHFPPVDTYNSDLSGPELHHAATNFRDKGVAGTSLVPFGHGDGGGGPTREMLAQAVRTADLEGSPRVTVTTPQAYFEAAEAEYTEPPVWVGELYLEMHRATYTSQARIKRANRTGEHLLREAELWATTAAVRAGYSYPAEELQELWRTVLLGQFHDILPGSSISWVYRDMLAEHARVQERLHEIIAEAQQLLAGEGETAVVFNAGPLARRGVPALGGAVADQASAAVEVSETGEGYVLEHEALRVVIDRDGLVSSIWDKAAAREVVPPGQRGNLLQLHQDFPNQYDAWDVDPFYRNNVVDIATAEAVETSSDATSATVTVRRTLEGRPITQTVTLRADAPGVHIGVEVDWASKDKFLKLGFPVDVHTDHARYEVQMGHLTRPTHTNTSWDFYRFEVWAHRWLHVSEPGYGVALANEATYGYDLTRHAREGGGTFHMLRASLLRGPGYPDPRTDHGTHSFGFVLVPGAGVEDAIAAGYASNLPLREVTGSPVEPLVTVDGGPLVEAVKLAQDGSGDVVVRLYEPHGARATAALAASFDVAEVTEVDLHERLLTDESIVAPSAIDEVDGATVRLRLRPFQVVTLRLRRA
ncbi:alpha-mannosidase [Pseudactinotalea suaedae]|uniref:alpha-mannosidase n=1 Tax=Pseudactinotalea suaedae TaxID=1524924 RepID=UPI0012E0EE94|nr:glycoside hydrolase family 38 C-terminal domain-containing protein [Pseudactinotalea suaedae]